MHRTHTPHAPTRCRYNSLADFRRTPRLHTTVVRPQEDCRERWKVIEAEKEQLKLEKSRRRSQAEDGDDEDDTTP